MTDIPTLDFSRFRAGDAAAQAAFVADLGRACRETGFVLLTGHGIAPARRAAAFAAARAFFALPDAEKARLSIDRSAHNRGYVAPWAEALDPASGRRDGKEAFNIGLDLAPDHPDVLAGKPFRGPNLWPDDPAFRAVALDWFAACLALGLDLHRAFARDLGLPDDWFAPRFRAPMATLRMLRYPAGGRGLGAGAHTDYGSITLLATDGTPGLEVLPRGAGEDGWIAVPDVPDAFVVNIGDCLMRWTNDVYVSTPHRVRAPRRERLSLAFFLDPDPDAVISAVPTCVGPDRPARHPDITGAEHLAGRLDATYGRRGGA